MAAVRDDGPQKRTVSQDANVQVRASALHLRKAACAHDGQRQRDQRDKCEGKRCAAPAERLEQEPGREERERAAEIERRDVGAHGEAPSARRGMLRDEPDAGHVHAGQPEAGEDPQQRSTDDISRAEREGKVRERGGKRAGGDDAR